MTTNDFETNTTVKNSKPFSKRIRILLYLSIFMTGCLCIHNVFKIIIALKEGTLQSPNVILFAWRCLFFLCTLCCFVSLIKISHSDNPFSKILVTCMKLIGFLIVLSSILFPRLSGYHPSDFLICSYGSFVLIDGGILSIGILIIIFGCLIHEGFRMQTDLDEIL